MRVPRRRAELASYLLFGLVLVAASVLVATNLPEVRRIGRLVGQAHPWWLAGALVLQLATYAAQAETWRVVTRAAGYRVSLARAVELSLVTLFINQAVPSAGVSGTVVLANALARLGVSRRAVMAAVVVTLVSYYAAYVLALGAALVIAVVAGHASPLIAAAAALFIVLGTAFVGTVLLLSGREARGPRWVARLPVVRRVLELLGDADARLVRSLPLTLRSGAYQLMIVLLDGATIWVLIRALGVDASPSGVFASFVLSSLLRTIGLLPGGLGAFEAASVVTLGAAGVGLPVALAATLLFRGLSFWLPMLPGLVLWRQALRWAA